MNFQVICCFLVLYLCICVQVCGQAANFEEFDKNDGDKRNRKGLENKPKDDSVDKNLSCSAAPSCEKCVGVNSNYKCMWCGDKKGCVVYPIKSIVPAQDQCSWDEAKWGVCWLDFKAMLISVSIIGGLILLIACCCIVKICKCFADCLHIIKTCVCCCCCCGTGSGHSKREERSLRRLEEMARRQERRDQLMLKFNMRTKMPYGANNQYEKFENSPI